MMQMESFPPTESPLAGQSARRTPLIDVAQVVTAYYANAPDPSVAAQRVAFGTSGHRGAAEDTSFNEWHVQAIVQAICMYRHSHNIHGPLFLGVDTHALSRPACASALEVLAANGIDVMLAVDGAFTPTPAVSHAIINYNRGRTFGLADGIVVTPSHNPPRDGGIKYNACHGGPAEAEVTGWIEASANGFLEHRLAGVQRIAYAQALRVPTTHSYDFRGTYVAELGNLIDMAAIRSAGLHLGVDPMGGAGVHYWGEIADHYGVNLNIVSDVVDQQFGFMSLDHDGVIRMDPSSPSAMHRLLAIRQRFDIAFACDPDHDRHGIVTPQGGLMPANDYLAVCADYLLQHRPQWGDLPAIGKTMVSTGMIDLITAHHGRGLFEVPVGFKWFAAGLLDGSLGFAGEESAGASFLRLDGTVWSTDKDGIAAALLAAEITARTGLDPARRYVALTEQFGPHVATRREAPATPGQKHRLAALTVNDVTDNVLAGEPIVRIQTHASGNGAALGGIKVYTADGWFAARPSGTEPLYRIYAESARGQAHLQQLMDAAQSIVETVTAGFAPPNNTPVSSFSAHALPEPAHSTHSG